MDQALAVVPLSARGFVTLLEIEHRPIPTQAHLARRLGLGRGTTSDLLRRLERAGMVRRDPARRGGRRPLPPGRQEAATLTETGRAALAEAVRIAGQIEDDWARRLGGSGESAMPGLRAYGLRRWLTESAAALERDRHQ
jgi:DNA-binding MarR family transcriptional regulator